MEKTFGCMERCFLERQRVVAKREGKNKQCRTTNYFLLLSGKAFRLFEPPKAVSSSGVQLVGQRFSPPYCVTCAIGKKFAVQVLHASYTNSAILKMLCGRRSPPLLGLAGQAWPSATIFGQMFSPSKRLRRRLGHTQYYRIKGRGGSGHPPP